MDWLTDAAYQWYSVMSRLSTVVGEPLQQFLGSQNIPGLSALLLGLLGGLAPCQVTANAGAIAYVTQAGQDRRRLWAAVRDFLGGKIAVYVTLGVLAAFLGWKIPTPALAWLRKLSGPLMIFVGLYLAGLIRLRGESGARITQWVRERTPRRGSAPFWLGVAFSLGFCPTMAVIFFGALVPLIVQANAGLMLPVVFALGTAVPVILWAAALTAGKRVAGQWIRRLRKLDTYVRAIAAAVLLLVGLNDTLLYWFL